MADRRDILGWVLAVLAGLVLWTVTAILGGRSEPWDSELYWSVAYPLAALLSGVFGACIPERPWRWAVAISFAEVPVMMASGSGLGLLPLGLVLLSVLALPLVVAAKIGARVRAWAAA
jgi:hypothetical protein